MVTPEERQEIIDAAVEKALLLLPETMGNLLTEHAAISKMTSQFYKDHPEFKDKKDVVASVIEQVDGENPALDYKEILKTAVPKIRSRLKTMEGLDMESVSEKPDRTFDALPIPSIKDPNGAL